MIEVSIIITNHNYSKYLNRSIRSAFVQNFQVDKYEIIVVDDQSDDWSKEIINSYGKLIRSIFLDKNVGLAASRNIGIRAAVGKYILFLDADDYLNRDITFVGYIFLESNLVWDAIAFDYFLIDDDEAIIGRNSCSDMPIACGIMFRKEKLMEIGMYDESFKMHEDKDLQIRFMQKFIIHHIELPLYRYRHHDSNMTKDLILDKKYMKKLKDKHHLESEIY